jgi:hypothetical protein
MAKTSFSWLHLTDLHYGLKGQDCLWPNLREPFLESLGPLHDRCGPWDAVLFTGDLVQSGKSEQFDVWSKQHDVCLLLAHQGPEWLTLEAQRQGESEIAPAGRFVAHLFGHQHEAEITYIRRGGSPRVTRHCQGCSVFGMDKFGDPPKIQRAHGYAAGRIEFGDEEAVLQLWPRIATNNTGPRRFIPDHEHVQLESDEGTAAEPVAVRSRATRVKPSEKHSRFSGA